MKKKLGEFEVVKERTEIFNDPSWSNRVEMTFHKMKVKMFAPWKCTQEYFNNLDRRDKKKEWLKKYA